jgi:hypothetical protein
MVPAFKDHRAVMDVRAALIFAALVAVLLSAFRADHFARPPATLAPPAAAPLAMPAQTSPTQ